MTTIEVQVLGRFALLRGGEPVPPAAFGGRLARTMFRILLVERGTVVPRFSLIDALWGDEPPADPDANLNVLANRIRRALGLPGLLVTGEAGYALAHDTGCNVDADLFSGRVAAGLACAADGKPAAALRELDMALRMWAEPLPEDTLKAWAHQYRERLHRQRSDALAASAESALALHDHARAGACATEAALEQPLSEAPQLLLARVLAAAGDVAGALRIITGFRDRLAEELGLDPSPEAAELHLRLLRGESLPPPTRHPARVLHMPSSEELAFVGRAAATADLLRRVQAVPRATALVLGSAGAGKSRLLAEVALRLDVPVVSARAYLADRERPWGLARDLLRQVLDVDAGILADLPPRIVDGLRDIVPEIAGETAGRHDSRTRRALAVEGGLRVLERVSARGAVLVCDDVQWADASSLDLLSAVRTRLPELGMLVACRRAEVAATPRLTSFLAELESSGSTTCIDLQPLDASALAELVDGPDVLDVLAAETDGTPMAIEEVLRTLAREGRARPIGAGRWRVGGSGARDAARAAAETGQRRAIGLRFAAQPPARRELLALLALIAREVPASLMASAAGIAERDALDELQSLGAAELARVSSRGWAVAHDLIADTVVARLAPVERARLHGLLASALERNLADHGEVAHHRAGAGDAAAAATAYALAAGERLAHSATQEAGELAEAGLALQSTTASRAALLRTRAEVRARRGQLADAAEDLHEALAIAAVGPERARILSRMTLLATAAEDLPRARELAETALIEAGRDASARARALSAAAIVDMNTGQVAQADQRTAEAHELYVRLGDAHGVADIHDSRAMATFLSGAITEALVAFDRAARLFGDAGDLLRVITPRSTRGHALVFAGDPAAGLQDTEVALELALELGDPEGETYARWHRSEALSALGRPDEAIACAEQAVAIASSIGHRGWTATALRALGIAQRCAQDLTAAATSFAASLAEGQGVELFTSWARTQLAMVRTAQGRFDEAAELLRRALVEGPPLAWYDARLAQAELAAARGDQDAAEIAARSLQLARQGGHHMSALLLEQLASTAKEERQLLPDC